MDYNELQSGLQKLGVNASIATLLRYKKVGILPEAEKTHGGRGQGPGIDFPTEALAEAYANWKLFNEELRLKTETVVKVRFIALEALKVNDVLALIPQHYKIYPNLPEDKRSQYPFLKDCNSQIQALAVDWLINREIARQNFDPRQRLYIVFLDVVTILPLTGNFEEDEKRVLPYREKGAFTLIHEP